MNPLKQNGFSRTSSDYPAIRFGTITLLLLFLLIFSGISPHRGAHATPAETKENQKEKKQVFIKPLLDTPKNKSYFRELTGSIEEARRSIEVIMATAHYYPDHPGGLQRSLFVSLAEAVQRGVKVRVILDASDWAKDITKRNEKTAEYLERKGIEVKFDKPGTTTHAKVVIIDGNKVILGSSNWNYPTYAETFQSNVVVKSAEIARPLQKYFQALWQGKAIQTGYPARTNIGEEKKVLLLTNTAHAHPYFHFCKKLLANARSSIKIAMFRMARYEKFEDSFSNILLEELVKARRRGVEVKVLLDKSEWSERTNEMNKRSSCWLLLRKVEVRFDSPSIDTHNKLIVVDEESILIGSTNWSYYSLEKNNEIDLLIANWPAAAKPYLAFFKNLWRRGERPLR